MTSAETDLKALDDAKTDLLRKLDVRIPNFDLDKHIQVEVRVTESGLSLFPGQARRYRAIQYRPRTMVGRILLKNLGLPAVE